MASDKKPPTGYEGLPRIARPVQSPSLGKGRVVPVAKKSKISVPRRFADPVLFSAEVLGVIPHNPQMEYLLSEKQTKILVGGRRSGKTKIVSTETATLQLQAMLAGREYRQLIVAPGIDQATKMFDEVVATIERSTFKDAIKSCKKSPFPELVLEGGGVIDVRATSENGKYLRGHWAHRVVAEEAAYIPDGIITNVIGPMLADTGGKLVLLCTPGGKGALFHRWFESGKNGHAYRESFHFRSTDNPHIDQAYVEMQREELSALQFLIEYGGEFADEASSVFRWEYIQRAAVGELEMPASGRRYVIGWDPAQKRDRSAVVVLDCFDTPWRAVHVADLRGQDYTKQIEEVANLHRAYHNAKVLMDETGQGSVILPLLRNAGVHCEGMTFTNLGKAEIIQALVVAIEKDNLILPGGARDMLDELRYYRAVVAATGTVRYEAQENKVVGSSGKMERVNDDYVTALALAAKAAGSVPRTRTIAEENYMPFVMSQSPVAIFAPNGAILAGEGGIPDLSFGEEVGGTSDDALESYFKRMARSGYGVSMPSLPSSRDDD